MGREIRRVPKGWDHPKYTTDTAKYPEWVGQYKPLHDEDYETHVADWIKSHLLWMVGKHPDQKAGYKYYAEWNGSPGDPDEYRPKWDNANCYQLYETVSEGTPVSPVFETEDELIDYLVNHGDFWSQKSGNGTYSRKAAESVVRGGYAPSMIWTGSKVLTPEQME